MKDETVRRLNELARQDAMERVRAERHRVAVEEADREDED